MGVVKPGDWLDNDHCSIARTLEVVGERWALLILREVFLGIRRFDQMQQHLGIARNILADRLRTLVADGILEQRQYQERPPRYEYRLTERGIDLYPALMMLMAWGDKHLSGRRGPALALEHKGCGHATTLAVACGECGERVTARDIRPLPGPGAPRKARRPSPTRAA
jgi:DNA-binding HxlR family transcriptional regulator